LLNPEAVVKLVERIRDLRAEAEDCMLIGQLATNDTNEKIFKERARRLLEIASVLEKAAVNEHGRGSAHI
jgi:hypothetical protein